MSEFDFERGLARIKDPVELGNAFSTIMAVNQEGLSTADVERMQAKVLADLYLLSKQFNFIGREYEVRANRGIFQPPVEEDEPQVPLLFIPEGTNTFLGQFACHFYVSLDRDGVVIDDLSISLFDAQPTEGDYRDVILEMSDGRPGEVFIPLPDVDYLVPASA